MHKVELLDSSEFKDKKVYYKHLFNKYKHWLKYLIYVILWLIGGRVESKILTLDCNKILTIRIICNYKWICINFY